MVLNRRSGETITGGIRSQWKIRSRVEVAAVKGRVAYQKSRLEGGTDLIPTTWHWGVQGQSHVRGGTIIVQEGRKEE